VPSVAGNAAELREILTNLIFNAVDAMPSGGTITVSTRSTNAGGGLGAGYRLRHDEQERERCLEPFFTTKGEHGTGLGFRSCTASCSDTGARSRSRARRGWARRFTIALPATPRGAETPETSREVDRTPAILVVDDQEIICELIAEYLKSDGHETMMAQRTGGFGISSAGISIW
jgi:hypothetical protein